MAGTSPAMTRGVERAFALTFYDTPPSCPAHPSPVAAPPPPQARVRRKFGQAHQFSPLMKK